MIIAAAEGTAIRSVVRGCGNAPAIGFGMIHNPRQTNGLMRFALLLGSVLTFLSGVQLFVLTDRTADFFAWTIGAGATATIMGAFYWTACTLSFLSWRRQPWVRARVGVPGVTLFLWATLATTLLHLDKFHFSGSATAQFAAWAWLVIYVVDPILVTIALVLQWRTPGVDPDRVSLLAPVYRIVLAGSGALFAGLGLLMLFAPSVVAGVSPMPLTALTSRSIGSWVLAMGVVFVTMMWENDVDRIKPAAVACLVLPALLVVGMVRYWELFTWQAAGWVYPGLIALVAVLGAIGIAAGGRGGGKTGPAAAGKQGW